MLNRGLYAEAMRLLIPKRRSHWITLAVIAPTLAVLFLISGCFQWSSLNCWHDDVDVKTGRIRHSQYLLYCKTADRIEETWLSRANGSVDASPDWRRVNTFSPGVGHSPHYRFHGAILQIKTLELADNTTLFDPKARRKVANTLLALWQNSDSSFDADDFVENVAQIATALRDGGASALRASDVPAGLDKPRITNRAIN